MALETFRTSESLTLGVELELQLVTPHDFDLTSAADDLLHLLARDPFPGDVKPEMTDSMIEISTGVHSRHDTLLAELRQQRDLLVAAGDRINVALCGGGTHPFQDWSERRIVEKPRYQELSALYGYLAKQFTVFGQHVHVGCRSADEAMYLLHRLNRYVPHFIALAASSPFSQGVDTAFDSARLNSVFAFPLSGRAPIVESWEDFETGYFAKMESTGVVKSMKDFYWDIRPKPEFGTIELRVCDTPLTIERAAALACYLQVIAADILDGPHDPTTEDEYLVYTYNRFQACRFGLDGTIVLPRERESVNLRDDILSTLRRLMSRGETLGASAALDELYVAATAGANGSTELRAAKAAAQGVEGVVEHAVRVFRS